jgi:hypothetical protein
MDGWYEEDCDACIVVATFPQFFKPEQVKYAQAYVLGHYGEEVAS